MKLKSGLLIIIAIITLFSSSCSRNFENTPTPTSSGEITTSPGYETLSVTYIGYEESYRFVSKSAPVLWMPDDRSPKVCDIQDKLVNVLFAGYTSEDNVWLFVSFMTYDTPTNNRGWIRESKTDKYTKDNQKLVNDIIIPKGTLGIDQNEDYKPTKDQLGFIEKREGNKVLVMFVGGEEVWYYKKDIKYPPLE